MNIRSFISSLFHALMEAARRMFLGNHMYIPTKILEEGHSSDWIPDVTVLEECCVHGPEVEYRCGKKRVMTYLNWTARDISEKYNIPLPDWWHEK